jgi:hypothetical protein
MVIAENDQSGPLGMVPISHTKTAISWDDGRAKRAWTDCWRNVRHGLMTAEEVTCFPGMSFNVVAAFLLEHRMIN